MRIRTTLAIPQRDLTEPQGPVNRAETMLNDATGTNSSC
jgi:hypothetical protein